MNQELQEQLRDVKSVKEFLELVKKNVDPKIEEIIARDVIGEFRDLVTYQVQAGGKRLRPALAVLSCLSCGGDLDKVLSSACSLEILHNYILIVDDIIDHSILRRSQATTWHRFGTSIAECIGMSYVASVFQGVIENSGNHELVIDLYARTLKKITDGQILDILGEQKGRDSEAYVVKNRHSSISEQEYLQMISRKTASLFQCSCEMGGIYADADKGQKQALRKFGFHLGISFQIQDDILDIFGCEEKFGKKIGKDIKERKLGNIVILNAIKQASKEKKRKMLAVLKKDGKILSQDVKTVVKLIRETDSKEKSSKLSIMHLKKANNFLRRLPKNRWSELLYELGDFVVDRQK